MFLGKRSQAPKHLGMHLKFKNANHTPQKPNNHVTESQFVDWEFFCLLVYCLILVTRCCSLLSEFEVLGSLEAQLLLGLTLLTFQSKNDLTSSLGLLVEDGLGLSTESHLFRVVTSLSLCKVGSLSGLVLSNLVQGVLLALSSTVSSTFLRYVNHCNLLVPAQNQEVGSDDGLVNFVAWTNRNPKIHFFPKTKL